MAKRTRKAGRPNEIGAKTVVTPVNLTVKQKAWLKRQAKEQGESLSNIVRDIINNLMEKSA